VSREKDLPVFKRGEGGEFPKKRGADRVQRAPPGALSVIRGYDQRRGGRKRENQKNHAMREKIKSRLAAILCSIEEDSNATGEEKIES